MPLSPCEIEVLRLGSEGTSARQTAEVLGISYRTVECHRANAIWKLRARNFTHAAILFERLAPVKAEEPGHG